ncbi:hypothetical protein GBF38_015577, partial [Nibea albiflora]
AAAAHSVQYTMSQHIFSSVSSACELMAHSLTESSAHPCSSGEAAVLPSMCQHGKEAGGCSGRCMEEFGTMLQIQIQQIMMTSSTEANLPAETPATLHNSRLSISDHIPIPSFN